MNIKLKNKYRIVYDSESKTIIMNPFEEHQENSITIVGNGREASEFDTHEEAESYIKRNNLVYEPATEDWKYDS